MEQKAMVAMIGAILLYSLFPLFNAQSVGTVAPLVYVMKACLVACLIDVSIIAVRFVIRRERITVTLRPMTFAYLSAAALLASTAYAVLVLGFERGSNSAVTMLYELWPIAVLFLYPVLFKERFRQIGAVELVAAIVAFGGLALIVVEPSTLTFPFECSRSCEGALLGLGAAGLMAIAVLFKAKAVLAYDSKNLSFSDFAWIDFINRLIAATFALIGVLIFYPQNVQQLLAYDSSIGFGVIEGLGGLLYWFAISFTRRSSIQLLLYLAPVIGFLWLIVFGFAELSAAIIFGSAMIFSANVVAHFRGEQTVAFFMTVVAAVLLGAVIYSTQAEMADAAFALLSAPITLYAILIGFLLSRIADRNLLQREACLDVLDHLPPDLSPDATSSIVRFLQRSFRTSGRAMVAQLKQVYVEIPDDRVLRSSLAKVAYLRTNPVTAGETLSVVIVGVMVIASGFVGRPSSFFGDMFVFILGIVVTYLSVSIIEQKDIRPGEARVLAIRTNLISHDDDRTMDFLVAGISLVIGIVLLVAMAIALKHDLVTF